MKKFAIALLLAGSFIASTAMCENILTLPEKTLSIGNFAFKNTNAEILVIPKNSKGVTFDVFTLSGSKIKYIVNLSGKDIETSIWVRTVTSFKDIPKEDDESFDVEDVCSNYTDLLDLYYEDYTNSRNHDYSFTTSLYFEPMSAASGYFYIDLNNDGIDELLLTEEYGDPHNGDADGCIYEGYTLINGKPHRFIEGWTRKRNFLLDNGDIFEIGSDGAGFESYLIYRFNGLNLDFVEGYASSEYEEEGEIKGGMYRTLDGSYTTNPSLIVTDEEFATWLAAVDKRQIEVYTNWIPFSEYPSHRK